MTPNRLPSLLLCCLLLAGCSPLEYEAVLETPETVEYGDTVRFKLYYNGEDTSEGQLSPTWVAWISDLEGELGRGPLLSVSTLSPGVHTVSLEVHDDQGQVFVADRVTVTVADVRSSPPPPAFGPEPDLGPALPGPTPDPQSAPPPREVPAPATAGDGPAAGLTGSLGQQ